MIKMFEEYVSATKGRADLASRFGVSRMTLNTWVRLGVPFGRIAEVSKHTKISVISLMIETYQKRYGIEGLSGE